jgi:kynureninase
MRTFQAAAIGGQAGRLAEAELLNPIGDDPAHARFLAFRHAEAAAWKARLMAANVVVDVRDDVIRFGFGLYQDAADVERLIEASAQAL